MSKWLTRFFLFALAACMVYIGAHLPAAQDQCGSTVFMPDCK
jgi:hypothetical protein